MFKSLTNKKYLILNKKAALLNEETVDFCGFNLLNLPGVTPAKFGIKMVQHFYPDTFASIPIDRVILMRKAIKQRFELKERSMINCWRSVRNAVNSKSRFISFIIFLFKRKCNLIVDFKVYIE
jgi:hypothetical protein